ncbi:pentatricopeptide repeat-containing protein At1g74750-like [Typha angustifolia]|uniref:pentatricopeptide repeat-containing protein At1g74750-like n=1 Tax=Typha angustifolia TaxID=59011 RepID=UPI003C2FA5F4
MLRAKQLGTLTQCARSFYLSGPRCGSADGASCTCSEDETSVPRRQPSSTGQQKKKASFSAEAPVKAASPYLQNAVGSVGHKTYGYAASLPHIVSSPSTLKSDLTSGNSKSNHIHDADHTPGNNLHNSSRQTAEHFAKPATATSGVFSEKIVNYRIAGTDGHGIHTPQTCMVDSSQPLSSSRSSSGKSRNKAYYSKDQPHLSSDAVERSNCNSSQLDDFGDNVSRADYVQAKKNISEPTVVNHRLLSETKSQRQSVKHVAKFHSDSFASHAKPEELLGKKMPGVTYDNIGSVSKSQHAARSVRVHAGGAASNFRSANSLRAVERYSNTLQQLKWGPATEHALDDLQCKLDAFQANQVLKLLHDHSVALGFFKWLKCQPGFRHDGHTYTTMIGILGQARQFGLMRKLLEEMIRDGCRPTVVTYNRLIHAYGRANYIGEAVKVFQEMQEAGYDPDRVTYCTLIDIHAKAGYLEVAMNLYHKMQVVGLSPDTFTYSAMVNCLGKGGHLAAAYKLFCEMIDHGCVPNLVTYNIMIALQAKARNYSSVVNLYRDMQAAGFRPDKITYSIVMDVLGRCGRLDEAEAVFVEMKRDWVPDEPVYGLLVDLWGKAGNVDKAQAWYQAMLDSDLRPNVPTSNSLLSAFLKVHRFADAYNVLQNMLHLGLFPSLQTYTLLLSCCTENSPQMGLCCQLMAITGHPAHMFLSCLPDAEPGGQNVRAHAGHFLDMIHSEDRESKRGFVDAVIDFLHKSGLKEEAGFVWEVASQRNVYPDSIKEKSSSYWLINLHVMSEGTALTALSRTLAWFHRQMLASGIGPQRIDIITGWGRRSRVTGSSLVRRSVQELLDLFRFPFFTENGNTGCFVGCGESLNRWLLNSYIERMHLL